MQKMRMLFLSIFFLMGSLPIIASQLPLEFIEAQNAALDLCEWGSLAAPTGFTHDDYDDLILTRDLAQHVRESKFPELYLRGDCPDLMAQYELVLQYVARQDLHKICEALIKSAERRVALARLHIELEGRVNPIAERKKALKCQERFQEALERLNILARQVAEPVVADDPSREMVEHSRQDKQGKRYARFAKKMCVKHLAVFFNNALCLGRLEELSVLLACMPSALIADTCPFWAVEWRHVQQSFNQDPKVMQYKMCVNIIEKLQNTVSQNWPGIFPSLRQLAGNAVTTAVLPPACAHESNLVA